MTKPATIPFSSYATSIPEALDVVGAAELLSKQTRILIKPNLVNSSPFPVTTHPECCAAVVGYIQKHSQAEIVIGEGCGDACLDTHAVFSSLGYDDMAARMGVELEDLNTSPLVTKELPGMTIFPQMHLPEILFTHFIVSVPVLKAHSLAKYTGTLKNMIGVCPPEYYAGQHGTWKKAFFHGDMQRSISELCAYRQPDLSIIDGSVGLCSFHLGGPPCDPPVAKIIAGIDPFEVDRIGASLLGLDWKTITHLKPLSEETVQARLADNEHGRGYPKRSCP